MKFKSLLNIAVIFSALLFITSCDDDMDSIGASIQPGVDDIVMGVGEIPLEARTARLVDEDGNDERLYITDKRVMLGELTDPDFGNIKADFLSEFFIANGKFELGYDNVATIDSVKLHMAFAHTSFTGDSISTMGVSVYEINKEPLKVSYYTDTDPTIYSDRKIILGQRFFSPQDLMYIAGGKILTIDIDKAYGERIYNAWMNDPKALSSVDKLREITKGIYVTTDFSKKAIIGFQDIQESINMNVHYSYKRKKENGTDSIHVGAIPFPIGSEAKKMNRVINYSAVEDIQGFDDFDTKTFAKSPSGVATKITIPLSEIRKQGEERMGTKDFKVNAASFKLVGFTEEERNLSLTSRPSYLLFINTDSLKGFLNSTKDQELSKRTATTRVMLRNATDNTYNFSNTLANSSISNNLASLINHYLKEMPEKDEVSYYVIPVTTTVSTAGMITSVRHLYSPTANIFRTSGDYMKMSMIYSKYNK